MPQEKSRLVYSTDRMLPQKQASGEKDLQSDLRPEQQRIVVRLDRKARRGKSVTVIEGLQMPQQKREELLRQFKTILGTGGTVKDSGLEIQGDHCDVLRVALTKIGYRPERSGG